MHRFDREAHASFPAGQGLGALRVLYDSYAEKTRSVVVFSQAIAGLIDAMGVDVADRLRPHRVDDAERGGKAHGQHCSTPNNTGGKVPPRNDAQSQPLRQDGFSSLLR